jgi:ATP-dependent helicase/nuclease subunit B
VRISFLSGPAGTGKTFRCLSEIRSELSASAEGAPLIFLAPKQSTYQLERQLLEGGLGGFSRLHILSFERLANWVFTELKAAEPEFISEQGRTMVLRALLNEFDADLTVFRSAARRLGFAEEVSKQIREFQNHGLSPANVRRIAEQIAAGYGAREKLSDLAFIYERYTAWLAKQKLEDGDALLTAATELLEKADPTAIQIGGLWFDGFAQLTPQELKLLVAVLRFTPRATLAFCVDAEVNAASKISAGFLVSQTLGRCRAAIEQRYGREVATFEILERDPARSRFAGCEALAHLERCWNSAQEFPREAGDAIRIVQANDPEAEAVFVAREVIKHVRGGGRYREVALLLRDLQNDYPHVLRRVFRHYEIPYFLDHRESVAHHPLAELTRGALRTVAFNWKHHDWFATLKSGLIRMVAEDLDELENAGLAHGWNGSVWKTGFNLPKNPGHERKLNRVRERVMIPFLGFANALGMRPRVEQLAAAIRELWKALGIEQQLETWSQEDAASALHATVWDQMKDWLNDLELAFRGQQLVLAEWLPIIEAGLRNLTVGVVPPVLDQVLIGTVDRSRNPDLKVLFVLGVNERVFPAPPSRGTLLTEDDRDALCTTGCTIGETPAWRMAGEQFYGYIACTRPRERLVLSYARTAMDGAQLNPSRFITQVRRLFPKLDAEQFSTDLRFEDIVHKCELAALGLNENPEISLPAPDEQLDVALANRLYGDELNISVSSLERFAACPYKFFLEQGLGVRERKEFLLDVREQGSFQHEVLSRFHEDLQRDGLEWRDVTPEQAKTRVAQIADEIIPQFHGGLLASTEQNRFTAENYKAGLQELIGVLIEFCQTNRFDPAVVEFGFGKGNPVPGWRVELADGKKLVLHGRVDRVDLHRVSETEALCVVIDYKSGLKPPNRTLLHHGVQQQLPAYLLAITKVGEIATHLKFKKISAAGCFLLPLSAQASNSKNRREALADLGSSRRNAYTHEGLFDVQHLTLFDSTAPSGKSGQFKFRITNALQPYGNTFNALKSEDFSRILDRSEELIREFGQRIFSGDIAIHPYKKGAQTACERCDYQAVCRFDPWTQKFNVLTDPPKAGGPGK